MDYIETFKSLRTNNKYGRKSPHKAVLMLAVIDLYEHNVLTENEIYYDDCLKTTFLEFWNKVFPDEPLIQSEAYLPFWYLQNDSFWHIVPIRGKEDILSLMLDINIKPSEAKLKDCVKYAELDEDLYFLMTLTSGRSSLKRALLETYTNLTSEQIDKLSESVDNAVDYSASALSEYKSILLQTKDKAKAGTKVMETDNELVLQFQRLDEDIQIVLNLQYFSFLKSHRKERERFKDICPTVYDLLDKIITHPVKRDDISPSFVYVYDNFLSELKISLMGEEESEELIDKVGEAIELLRANKKEEDVEPIEKVPESELMMDTEDVVFTTKKSCPQIVPEKDFATEGRKDKPWTENEEELITLYFQQGKDAAAIASIVGRTELSIKMRLAKIGLIDFDYREDSHTEYTEKDEAPNDNSQEDYQIENLLTTCSIYNKFGKKIFTAEGKLKYINGKLYRLNLKQECFTVKDMILEGEKWLKGSKKIVAYPQSELYSIIDNAYDYNYLIEEIEDSPFFGQSKLKVKGSWYNSDGEKIDNDTVTGSATKNRDEKPLGYEPKGKLKEIPIIASCSYDFLWTMAIVEFMQFKPQPQTISYDTLACMTIAIAWELLNHDSDIREKETNLSECIEYLINESKTEMDVDLDWDSSKKVVFQAIRNFPMSGAFEDLVDELLEKSPYNVLKAWFPDDSNNEVIGHSSSFEKSCLYAIHPDKRDPYIELNTRWMRYLFNEHDDLLNYFRRQYLNYFN